MKTPDTVRERVTQLSAAVQQHIRDQGFSYRDVEDRLDMGRDYLSQLLRGAVDLKVKHLFAVLEAIEVEPADVFAPLYGLLTEKEALGVDVQLNDYPLALALILQEIIHKLRRKGLLSDEEAASLLGMIQLALNRGRRLRELERGTPPPPAGAVRRGGKEAGSARRRRGRARGA